MSRFSKQVLRNIDSGEKSSIRYLKMTRFSYAVVVWLPLSVAALDAGAATWSEQLLLPVVTEYDTNPSMASSNYHSVWRLVGSPGVKILAVKELDRWNADVSLRIQRSSDKAVEFDREDPTVSVGWTHEFEKGEFGMAARYDEASSRSSELLDTGLVQLKDGTRFSKSISAHWLRAMSDKLSLSLDGEYKKLRYSSGPLGGNSTQSINAKINYSLSDRLTPFVSAAFSRFQPDVGGNDTRSVTGMLGLNWLANERISYGVRWGLNTTSTAGSSVTGWQGGGSVGYTGDRSISNLEYSRSTGSSGASSSISSDQLTGRWSYMLNEKDSAGADFSWRKNLGNNPVENRQVDVWYGRDLTSLWNFRFKCEYKQNETNNSSANATVVGATVTYTTPNF